MRTALVLTEDAKYIDGIMAFSQSCHMNFCFAETVDEAIGIIGINDIAVAIIDYTPETYSITDFIQLLYTSRSHIQIIMLYSEKDSLNVLNIHNSCHLCRVLCKEKAEPGDLKLMINHALELFEKKDVVFQKENENRKREDNIKKTIRDMTEILNDRAFCYRNIEKLLLLSVQLLGQKQNLIPLEACEKCYFDYISHILSQYTQLYLLKDLNQEKYFDFFEKRYSDESGNEHFSLNISFEHSIENEIFCNIAFLSDTLASFYSMLYDEYKGKIEVTEDQDNYILNILYEAVNDEEKEIITLILNNLIKRVIVTYSDKAIHGQNERITQYKMYFKKNYE